MDGCSLLSLIACFSWSGVYVDGGLLYQDSGVEEKATTYEWYDGGYHLQASSDDRYAANPYGRMALGYELRFSSVTLALEAAHTSSIATNQDRGVNEINLRARWYPFR